MNEVIGYVRIEIKGEVPEQFINECQNRGIVLWDLENDKNGTISADILTTNVKDVRWVAKKTGCKFRFLERHGGPFFVRRVMKRYGFVAGIGLFFAVLWFLSNLVWNVEIEGATPELEHELRLTIEELGVRPGVLQSRLPSPEELQSIVSAEVSEATWIGVNVRGTTYQFQVVQKELAEPHEDAAPRHLVANRDAVVHDIFVEHGEAQVKEDDYVEKGDVLISGLIGNEENQQQVAATGSVEGEIWYETKVTVPLERTYEVIEDEPQVHHRLLLGSLRVPLWGIREPEAENIKQEVDQSNWKLFGYDLPFGYEQKRMYETENYTQSYEEKEAVEVAKEFAKEEIFDHVDVDAEIKDEKVLHHEVENGKVKVNIHYEMIEEIVEEQPIVQGD
ncbi:hypothetical protein HNQ41_002129 [Texcoconibacillus texcoconensis]|uniref:Sporulation protein YqfD n=2 Tax=Texcoconibacillus texcoconensis TaxID=1095777 RepID=A0A840QRG4_9BACI|nr:hypothetical protein [Texcoconibacillus texcoconensis]